MNRLISGELIFPGADEFLVLTEPSRAMDVAQAALTTFSSGILQFYGEEDRRRGFLEGILDGDGKNPRRESNPAGRRDLKTASRSLAWGVRALLADIGHWATISTGESPSVFPWSTSLRPNRWYRRLRT